MPLEKRGFDLNRILCRQLQQEDIAFAYEMTKTEMWNVTIEDVRRMFKFEPDGCFMAELEGAPAGHVFSVTYGKLDWIGLLIIKKEFRRMGIARLLMLKANKYLLSRGVQTIRLEVVSELSELYRGLGFVDEYDSLRFEGAATTASSETKSISPMSRRMVGEVAKFDAGYFGAKRIKVIERLYEAYPEMCYVSHSGSKILGYIMVRKAEEGYNLGPWVCIPEKKHIADSLLTACLQQIDKADPVYLGVPAPNQSAIEILRNKGFVQFPKSIRMFCGQRLSERVEGVFAIGGAMKG